MVTAHQQAWIWQDEWVDLTMTDIRRFEFEIQEFLRKKMAENGQSLQSATSIVDMAVIDKDKDDEEQKELQLNLPIRSQSQSVDEEPSSKRASKSIHSPSENCCLI